MNKCKIKKFCGVAVEYSELDHLNITIKYYIEKMLDELPIYTESEKNAQKLITCLIIMRTVWN